MSILSRIPNLISSTPTSAPQEAMIASQKAHIDELVQKTRTLDDAIKRLQDQLSNSRDEWQAERREWADGCDSLMACHRIAHLRTNVLLAQERVALAHERDLTRRERVAVIQRDYNLILFKAREKELELEADKLREESRGAADGNVALVAELKEKLAAGMRELKEKAALLRDAEKARAEAEEQTTQLRSEHAALQTQLSSARTNVERLTLRLEDAQTGLAEKDRLNSELQQEKAALKVQVGKWKSLDDRGGVEVEELKKHRAALESQITRLESRLTEEQNKTAAHEKAMQKEHKKIEKLQQALEEQARIAEETKTAAEAGQHNGATDAKMQKKIPKLMTALEEQVDKTAKAEEEATLLEEQSRHYKEQLDNALRQIEKLTANPQPSASRSRSRVQSDRGPNEVEVENPAHSGLSPSDSTKAGPSGKKAAPVEPDGNGKKVAKKPDKGNKGRQKSQSTATDSKGKRKAPPDGDDTDTIESTSEVATKPTKSKAQKKNQTKAKEPRLTEAEVDADDAAEPKRKKMKKLNVNIFGSAKPDSLDWANQFNLGAGGALDIPTQLSPLKVPARSLARKSTSTSFR